MSPAVDQISPCHHMPRQQSSVGGGGCLETEMTTWSQDTNTGRDQANPEIPIMGAHHRWAALSWARETLHLVFTA